MNGDEDDEDEDAYYSLDEEGDSTSDFEGHDPGGGEREAVAREIERRRVLEAAGLVVSPIENGEEAPRPRPCVPSAPAPIYTRTRSDSSLGSTGSLSESLGRKRRPAPAAPAPRYTHGGLSHLKTKDLPPIPRLDLPTTDTSPNMLFGGPLGATATDKDDDDAAGVEAEAILGTGHVKARSDGSIVHPDDAFERYESFKKMQGSQSHAYSHSPLYPYGHGYATPGLTSRMSTSSFDMGSLAPTSPPRSPATLATPSLREREREQWEKESGESRTSQFLSFLGRHHTRAGTPDIAERDRKLVISGPIIHTPAPTPSPVSAPLPAGGEGVGAPATRVDSSVFGSSWASLVDRSALEEIPKQERRRQEAIFELIATEADYVRDLQLVVEVRVYDEIRGVGPG